MIACRWRRDCVVSAPDVHKRAATSKCGQLAACLYTPFPAIARQSGTGKAERCLIASCKQLLC
jgi:hypothetical protein